MSFNTSPSYPNPSLSMIPISSLSSIRFPSHPDELCHLNIQSSVDESQPALYISIECPNPNPSDNIPYYFSNNFTASYIESITKKAANSKKFKVFMDMLIKATTAANSSTKHMHKRQTENHNYRVSVDLLTASDLVSLKSGVGNPPPPPPPPLPVPPPPRPTSDNDSKRYLILTYTTEFDRVHYPLPVILDSDPMQMRRTITRLMQSSSSANPNPDTSADTSTSSYDSVSSPARSIDSSSNNIRKENVILRKRISSLEKDLQGEGKHNNNNNNNNTNNNNNNNNKNNSQKQKQLQQQHQQIASLKESNSNLTNQLKKLKSSYTNKIANLDTKLNNALDEVNRGKRTINSLRGRERELRKEVDDGRSRNLRQMSATARGRSPAHSVNSRSSRASSRTSSRDRDRSSEGGRPAWGAGGAKNSPRTPRNGYSNSNSTVKSSGYGSDTSGSFRGRSKPKSKPSPSPSARSMSSNSRASQGSSGGRFDPTKWAEEKKIEERRRLERRRRKEGEIIRTGSGGGRKGGRERERKGERRSKSAKKRSGSNENSNSNSNNRTKTRTRTRSKNSKISPQKQIPFPIPTEAVLGDISNTNVANVDCAEEVKEINTRLSNLQTFLNVNKQQR